MPVRKNVAETCCCSRISSTFRFAYELAEPLASLASMPVVMSASKVSATTFAVRGPLLTTGSGTSRVNPGGTMGSVG